MVKLAGKDIVMPALRTIKINVFQLKKVARLLIKKKNIRSIIE